MICPKCNRENEDGAMFCRYCGSSMNPVQEKESNISSILILVWIIAVGLLSITTNLYDNWYETFYIVIRMIHNIIMILPLIIAKKFLVSFLKVITRLFIILIQEMKKVI